MRSPSHGVAAAALALVAALTPLTASDAVGRERCFGARATIIARANQKIVYGTRRADVIVGTSGPDVIKARSGNDIVCGRGGDDVIRGGRGTDTLDGAGGADIVRGGKGPQDWLEGGPGDDRLDGGRGRYDAVLYGGAGKGVSVDLAELTAVGQGSDVLSAVDDVFGSPFDDILRGNDDEGGNGFFPGEGDDEIDGRGGFDLVLYSYSESGVTVDLANGTASGEGTDRLSGIEGARGSQMADTISGDGGANALYGGRGDDVLAGRGGDDYVHGGRGTDTLDGGEGIDVCVAGESVSNCDAPDPAGAGSGPGFGRVSCRWLAFLRYASGGCASTVWRSSSSPPPSG